MGHVLKSVSILAGVFGAVVLAGFAVFVTTVFTYDPQASAAGDAVVVLTGGELRVREGLRLFAIGAGRRLLISGVNETTRRSDLLRRSGIAPVLLECCIDVDQRARDTAGNAEETRAWVKPWGFKRLVVVTSNYHMPRSLLMLSRALPGVELVPHAVVSHHYQPAEWWRHPAAVKLIAIEYLKSIPAAARLAESWLTGVGAPPATSRSAVPAVTSSRPREIGFSDAGL